MASAAVNSKAMVPFVLIHIFCVCASFSCVLRSVVYSLLSSLCGRERERERERERAVCYFKSPMMLLSVCTLWLYRMVPWVGLKYVIAQFPGYTHLLFHYTIHCFNVSSCMIVLLNVQLKLTTIWFD